MRSLSACLVLSAALASSCSNMPKPGGEPRAPGWEPKDATKCHVKASQQKPLVVEWRGEERGALETQARRGLIVVRYDGCEMEVLQRCTAPSQYQYAGMNPKRDVQSIRNADELYAAVPMGAARLEGKLQQFGELNVQMTMVGRWEAATTEVKKSELQGADCAKATHVITGMTVGAFTFFAGASSEASGGASVAGVGGGAKSARGREELSQDGDPSKCADASDQDKEPVRNCSAVIRVEVAELGAMQTVCPEGTEQRGGQCVRKDVVTEVQCPAGTEKKGNQCVAVVNRTCGGGMHFVEGQGCVANVATQPTQQPRPASAPPSTTTTAASGGMVRIPAGTFMMGSNDDEDAIPVHSVRVASFEMDATEVTVGAYRQCVNAGGCSAAGTTQPCNWGQSGKEEHPVNCVDWSQAKAYCAWARKRLPTEEEWEYAARGKDGRKYPWGSGAPVGQLCWKKADGTCPVGSYPSGDSPFGLHDMAGNVWEWTSSGYSRDYGKNRSDSAFVNRGGSWADANPSFVLGSYRGRLHVRLASQAAAGQGFRCAR